MAAATLSTRNIVTCGELDVAGTAVTEIVRDVSWPYLEGMADACCSPPPLNLDRHRGNKSYRRVLWAVLAINAVMFLIEIGAGLAAGSASLQADALDFLGDAANYAISLMVVGMTLRYRAAAALAMRTLAGRATPPFGAPPETALTP